MLEKFIAFQLFMLAPRDEEDGATAVEYGLMVALIAVVCLLAVTALGVSVQGVFNNIATAV